MAVRPRSHAPPVAVLPVTLVVPAPIGRAARPVTHLVPRVAGGAQGLVRELVLGGLVVIIGRRHLAAPDLGSQFGALLDDKGVGRDVVRLEIDGSVQARPPVQQRLPRRAIDQVDADLEAGGSCGLNRPGHVDRVVGTFKTRQHVWHCRLHAHADPVEPASSQCLQRLRGDRVRVCLSSHLSTGGQTKPGPYAVQHPHKIARRQHGRGASAEEHGVDHRSPRAEHPDSEVELAQGGVGIRPEAGAVDAELGQRVGVEVAVAAPHRTERDVDVDTKRP